LAARAAKLEASRPALRLAEVAKHETTDDVGELAVTPSTDPFGDLRPRLPAGLDDLLDRAGAARPLALIGPGLAWR